MAQARWCGLSLVLVLAAGCEAEPGPETGGEATPLAQAPELVSAEVIWTAPAGADGAPQHRLQWRWPDGRTQRLELEAPAVAWTAWRHGAAVLDSERRLWRATPDEPAQKVRDGVAATPVASPDGRLLVYAVAATPRAEVHLHDGRHDRVIARATRTAGRFRFTPAGDAIVFIGPGDGGVAGVWVAPMDDAQARCLTNCDLVTGEPWGERFVPLPPSAASFDFDGDRLSWPHPEGGRVERVWKEDAR